MNIKMKEYSDKEISKLLQNNEFLLPDSYERRFEDTLNEIAIMKNRKKYFYLFASRVVAIIVLCIISLSLITGVVGAVVNRYHERMNSLSDTEAEKYNEDVQKYLDNDSDKYSRPLSESEQARMTTLRKEYETEGKFPANEILQVQYENEAVLGKLCFCIQNSTFYLPEHVLSDEEILQIVDFMEKRDYSVIKENKTVQQYASADENVSEKGALEIAKQTVANIFKIDASDASYKIEFDKSSSYYINLDDKEWKFDVSVEVDSDNGMVNRISLDYKDVEECISGIKVQKNKFVQYGSEIIEICNKIGLYNGIKKIRLSYNYLEDGTLNQGTVKYIVEYDDGSGYVLLYSVAADNLYDIYYIPIIEQYKKYEKQKSKVNKKNGIFKEKMVVWTK